MDPIQNGWRLSVPAGSNRHYRLAQLDDYAALPRRRFPHHSLLLRLRARASSASIPGTWGFGVWNDTFGLTLGVKGSGLRLPALPNTAWYFHASPESHLSLRDHAPGNGLLAQAFRSSSFDARLLTAAVVFPFSRQKARQILQTVVAEDGLRLETDATQWHEFELEWSRAGVSFAVDGTEILQTPVAPRPPMGIVIWIDNQFAAFTPSGRLGFGLLASEQPAWIEVKEISAAHP